MQIKVKKESSFSPIPFLFFGADCEFIYLFFIYFY